MAKISKNSPRCTIRVRNRRRWFRPGTQFVFYDRVGRKVVKRIEGNRKYKVERAARKYLKSIGC